MGGELGGRGFNRRGFATIMVVLWVVYLVLSGMQAVGDIQGFGKEWDVDTNRKAPESAFAR
jgi:hypothetical protein